jgi:hypothetical protein
MNGLQIMHCGAMVCPHKGIVKTAKETGNRAVVNEFVNSTQIT